jgi:hypothetical protein
MLHAIFNFGSMGKWRAMSLDPKTIRSLQPDAILSEDRAELARILGSPELEHTHKDMAQILNEARAYIDQLEADEAGLKSKIVFLRDQIKQYREELIRLHDIVCEDDADIIESLLKTYDADDFPNHKTDSEKDREFRSYADLLKNFTMDDGTPCGTLKQP